MFGGFVNQARSLRITLEISHARGDLGPDWRRDLKFPDYTTRFDLRWKYGGRGIRHLEYRVFDPASAIVARHDLGSAESSGPGVFSIGVGDLPKRELYRVVVQPTDGEGNDTLLPSNAVTMRYEEAQPVPFMFAGLIAEDFARDWNTPGLAGAVSCRPGDAKEWSGGIRRLGSTARAQNGDLWHIGSDTKAMTSTMIGRLVEDGRLGWDETIWDLTHGPRNLFPEVATGGPGDALHPRFQDVTIEHLACHRSGMVMWGAEDAPTRELANYTRDPGEFRWDVVRGLLTRDHTGTIGEWRYGHGNYMLLAVIIERIAGRPYEQTMLEDVFAPAGMTTANFGMPTDVALPAAGDQNVWVASPNEAYRVDTTAQPNGHLGPDDAVRVDNLALPPVWNSAGGVYLSMEDWLRFLRLHIDGRAGAFALSAATLDRLHAPYMRADRRVGPHDSPPDDQADPSYGWGWGIGDDGSGGVALNHGGTYSRFVAVTDVYVDLGFVVATAANLQGGPDDAAEGGPLSGDNAMSGFHNWLRAEALRSCDALSPDYSRIARTMTTRQLDGAERVTRPVSTRPTVRDWARNRATQARTTRTPPLPPIEEVAASFDPTLRPIES